MSNRCVTKSNQDERKYSITTFNVHRKENS